MLRYSKLSAILTTIIVLLGMTACTDELRNPDNVIEADENAITLSIVPETVISTRAAYSDGSMVNRIYYAIYKMGANGEYNIAKFYHLDPNEKYKVANYAPQDRKNFVVKLIPEAGEDNQYKMVCWAQYEGESNESDYYDLTDFPTIKVKYKEGNDNFANNDEARDAFYASQEFVAAQKGTVTEVVLTRPFAQINIGTSGWDYEGLASVEPDPKVIKYSTIKIKGVATTLDILNNKTTDDPKNLEEVTYEYSLIPALKNLADVENIDWNRLSGILLKDNSENLIENDDEESSEGSDEKEPQKGFFKFYDREEEFLKLNIPPVVLSGLEERDFDEDGDGFADYISWSNYKKYCTKSKDHDELIYNIHTQTFKYLSMSYVLVPFQVNKDDKGKETRTGSTVDVEFDCKAESTDPKGVLDNPVLTLHNVPVCSNNRTNIIAADGTGLFMNSNEMRVKIYHETFADYYKNLGATEKDWDNTDDGDDSAIGEEMNSEYGWPEEDIDPETGKYPIILPGIANPKASMLVNVKEKHVDFIKYLDKEVTVIIDPTAGFSRYKGVENYFNTSNLKYHIYIGDQEIDSQSTDNGKYLQFTVDKGQLTSYIYSNNITPVAEKFEDYHTDPDNPYDLIHVTDIPDLKYYPVEFRIVTDFGENVKAKETFYSEDFIGTIRYYTSYKFTFSANSQDEGREIIDFINTNGYLGIDDKEAASKLLWDEVNSKFIYEGTVAFPVSNHLEVWSRSSNTNNDKIYALKDHIRLRGSRTEAGHWIILKNLNENCKIRVKIGRDAGVDNSSGLTSKSKYNKGLHINWGQTAESKSDSNHSENDEKEVWNGIDPETESDRVDVTSDNKKTTAKYSETHIMNGYDTDISGSDGKDVKIYMCNAGHSYYWLILSEPGND